MFRPASNGRTAESLDRDEGRTGSGRLGTFERKGRAQSGPIQLHRRFPDLIEVLRNGRTTGRGTRNRGKWIGSAAKRGDPTFALKREMEAQRAKRRPGKTTGRPLKDRVAEVGGEFKVALFLVSLFVRKFPPRINRAGVIRKVVQRSGRGRAARPGFRREPVDCVQVSTIRRRRDRQQQQHDCVKRGHSRQNLRAAESLEAGGFPIIVRSDELSSPNLPWLAKPQSWGPLADHLGGTALGVIPWSESGRTDQGEIPLPRRLESVLARLPFDGMRPSP